MKTYKQSKAMILLTVIVLFSMLLVPTGNIRAQSAQHPAPAAPFEGDLPTGGGSSGSAPESLLRSATALTVYQNGANRLADLQNSDGSWGWPLTGNNPLNTLQPIGQGLAEAYTHTMDLNHRAALLKAGAFLLGKTNNFSPPDGLLAAKMDSVFGGNTYTSYVKTNFYDKLAAGTYTRSGDATLYTTSAYINRIRTIRSGNQANMAAWDLGLGLVGAASVGADTTDWVAGTEAEINELNGTAYYDVLGLAGAVYGLAYVGVDFDPTAGQHAAASTTADLGAILASYQISLSGGFAWNSNYVIPSDGNETIQETAYAILALNQLDRSNYLSNIQSADNYLATVQLGTGGWENYTSNGENNELTGEALWALSGGGGGFPLADIWVCPIADGDCGHPGASTHSIQAAIDAVGHSTIYLDAGTYNENATILVNKEVTIIGPSGGGAIVQGTNAAAVPIFEITSSNVTIQNLTITHNALPVFVSAGWLELPNSLIRIPSGTGLTGIAITDNTIYVPTQLPVAMGSWNGVGITVGAGTTTGISITGNTIYNLRDGVVVQYNNTATVSNNMIHDTKGGIMNYTNTQADADNRTMSGNSWGTSHNEWDIVWNTAYYVPDYSAMLGLSAVNNGAYILDRRAADAVACAALIHNRSHVFVNTVTGTTTRHPANGNINLPYATLALGNEAVVAGGTVEIFTPLIPLPSHFYGYINITDNPPTAGVDRVDAYIDGVGLAASTTILADGSVLEYQLDVPGDLNGTFTKEGGVEGDTITFKIHGDDRVVAVVPDAWHTGTNLEVDFHPPEALLGGPYAALVGEPISFSGSANDSGADATTYQWDWDNDGTYDETAQNPTHSWTTVGTGTYTVGLQVTDAQGGVGTATFAVNIASITLGNLSQVYDGTPKDASATTNPGGLTVSFAYSPTTHVIVGDYVVTATISGYIGSVTGTLQITQASSTVTVTCPSSRVYTGSAIEPCTATYSGAGGLSGPLTPIYTNNVVVGPFARADATYGGDANHTGSTNFATFAITPATATITLSDLNPVYNGSAKHPTVVTSPAGLSYSITYTPPGTTDEPSAVGTYAVHAYITDPNYSGYADGTMHIQATYDVALVPGWNLVSFNLVPMDTNPASVLNSLPTGEYDLVYGYDGSVSSNNWLKFSPTGPSYANNLHALHETMGFWIHMSVPDTLHVVGNPPTSTNIPLSTVGGGWNLVGFPRSAASGSLALPTALTDHGVPLSLTNPYTYFTLVYTYHAADTSDLWKLYDNRAPVFANDLTALSDGYGYWIWVNAIRTWEVGY